MRRLPHNDNMEKNIMERGQLLTGRPDIFRRSSHQWRHFVEDSRSCNYYNGDRRIYPIQNILADARARLYWLASVPIYLIILL